MCCNQRCVADTSKHQRGWCKLLVKMKLCHHGSVDETLARPCIRQHRNGDRLAVCAKKSAVHKEGGACIDWCRRSALEHGRSSNVGRRGRWCQGRCQGGEHRRHHERRKHREACTEGAMHVNRLRVLVHDRQPVIKQPRIKRLSCIHDCITGPKALETIDVLAQGGEGHAWWSSWCQVWWR